MRQNAAGKDTIPPCTLREAPLSFAQQRLWFLDQFSPGSCTYNVPRVLRLTGSLDVTALEHALTSIVKRHTILRTNFVLVKEEPFQVVRDDCPVSLRIVDLSDGSGTKQQTKAQQMIETEVQRPFDLSSDPMVRATLLRLNDNEHILILMTHHIASDGWSKGLMFREIAAFYNSERGKQPADLPELPIQYRDFAVWQRANIRGEILQKQLAYWKGQLAGAPALLDLPTDFPRPAMQGFAGATQSSVFPKELLHNLKTLSQREGTTLFMTLLAAFQSLLWRYAGQEDIVVGTPIAGRTHPEVEPLIGDFVNMLAMRTNLSGDPSFRELLRRVKETALQAYDNQEMPFEVLVEELERGRDISRSPVFQTIFILETAPPPPPAMDGLDVQILDFDTPTAKNDLIMIVSDDSSGLNVKLEYRTDLFTKASIQRFLQHFQALLEAIVVNPGLAITSLNILPEDERHQLLMFWNDTSTNERTDRCVHELFEEQCVRTPDAIAVEFQGRRLSYHDLNERANQLAHYLRKLGVRPDSTVGICVHRSLEMMVALLGILKAGGAYVPLDPTYPRERLEFMLQDIAASVIVTQRSLTQSLSSQKAHMVCIDGDWTSIAEESIDNLHGEVGPTNLSYVIFTSGSSGTPKGVQLEHRNVVNFLNSVRKTFALGEQDTYLGVASMSFDASVLDFYLPLAVGARLLIVDAEMTRDGHALAATISHAGVSAMHATPSTWRSVVDAGWAGEPELKVLSGGEALPWELAKELLPRCFGLWNLYGPTETAVYSVIHKVTTSDIRVLAGRPIDNTQIYILDARQQPSPIGMPGEIYIGGAGVARGYLNRTELTAEKFLADPFRNGPGGRMYRTGDLGRYRADGSLECLGRVDHQVKLRGFRIELGEVEAVLMQHPDVRQAVADVRTTSSGDKRLVAYLVGTGASAPTIPDVRSFLKSKLPDYMVPSSFVIVENLPLSSSGKLDRRALPDPIDERPELPPELVAQLSPVERAIAEIFSEVLEVRQVRLQDNFFELGGHSLLATRVISRLRDRFQIEMTPRFLFESPTVSEMASRISHLLLQGTNPDDMAIMLAELAEVDE
ncbi:MAG: amino acid adenylation domain-containing protein [Acidobacteriota bacterium]|nr:amino acid adenylation domain-containing protein [Acidobacteriota bacterium]